MKVRQGFYGPFFILLLVVGFCAVILPAQAVWVTDIGIKSIFSQSLLLNRFQSTAIVYPGRFMDLPLNFSPLFSPEFFPQNGEFHTVVNFFYPTLNAGLMKLFGFRAIYLLSYLAILATYALCFFVLRGLLKNESPGWGALLICLGTPLFFYGITGWEYGVAAFFVLLGFYLMGRGENSSGMVWYFWSGAFYGIAVWWREESYLIIFAFYLAYFFWGKRRQGLLFNIMGTLAFLSLLWLVQSTLGQGPLGSHLKHYLAEKGGGSSTTFILLKVLIAYNWLIRAHQNFWITLALSAAIFCPSFVFRQRGEGKWSDISLGCAAIGFALYFLMLVVNPDYFYNTQFSGGLFFSAPLLLFALFKTDSSLEETGNLQRQLFYGGLFSVILLVLAASAKSGRGMHIGARHLIPLYPLIGVLAWNNLSRLFHSAKGNGRKLTSILFGIILFFSVGIQAYSGVILGMKKFYSKKVITALRTDRSPFVITNVWWLPVEMASIFYTENFFYFGNMAKMELLVKRIARQGKQDFLYVTSSNYPKSIPSAYLQNKWGVEITARDALEAPRMKYLNLRLLNFRFKRTKG